MEFKYKVGNLVTCEMKQGIYQIVGQVEFKKLSKNCDPGARYYFRKVFDKNYEIKIGKADLVHETWLRTISLKKIEKLGDKINSAELNNIILDPQYQYYYADHFLCKKENHEEILSYYKPHLNSITIEQKDKIGEKLLKKKLIRYGKIKNNLKVKTHSGEELYRLEFGGYVNDYHDPTDETTKFFRDARLVKIKL